MSVAVAPQDPTTTTLNSTRGLYGKRAAYDMQNGYSIGDAGVVTERGVVGGNKYATTVDQLTTSNRMSSMGTVRTFAKQGGGGMRHYPHDDPHGFATASHAPSARRLSLHQQQPAHQNLVSSILQPSSSPAPMDIDLDTHQRVPSLQHRYDFFGFVFHSASALFPSIGRRHLEPSNNLTFILNCCMWYIASSMTNNTGKQILNAFRFPVTLTFVQFGLVALCCFAAARVFGATHIRQPTLDIARTIVPLAVFLIVGHVFSSIAISRIPVSLVHTIKALAPLFTVMLYRFLFGAHYTSDVYVSLLPLTLGVVLACSFTFSNNVTGLACALGSCLVFVTQNIFSKKILFKEAKLGDRNPNKLDKMNVLFYSSSISFFLMIPMWLYAEGHVLFGGTLDTSAAATTANSVSTARLIYYFILNGTMNFGQNWFAFTTLSLTSPVTYSILSLLKRIFVITVSILWFGQQVSWTQSFGILLTFFGLWLYQRAKHDVDRSERSTSSTELPTTNEMKRM